MERLANNQTVMLTAVKRSLDVLCRAHVFAGDVYYDMLQMHQTIFLHTLDGSIKLIGLYLPGVRMHLTDPIVGKHNSLATALETVHSYPD